MRIIPLLIRLLYALFVSECDQTFVSRAGGPPNGTFTAPSLLNPANHSRQCLYIFLAGPGQRVDVIFTAFNLRGSPPEYVFKKINSHKGYLHIITFNFFHFVYSQWSCCW